MEKTQIFDKQVVLQHEIMVIRLFLLRNIFNNVENILKHYREIKSASFGHLADENNYKILYESPIKNRNKNLYN